MLSSLSQEVADLDNHLTAEHERCAACLALCCNRYRSPRRAGRPPLSEASCERCADVLAIEFLQKGAGHGIHASQEQSQGLQDVEARIRRIISQRAATQGSRRSTSFVMRMIPTRLSSFLKCRISIERRRLPRPQTCVRGCKNLAWSTSQTSTSSTRSGVVRRAGQWPGIKCAECPNRRFLPVTDDVIRWHLSGCDDAGQRFVAGVYPMLLDETCFFLAVDFDKGGWLEDSTAFIETCRGLSLPAALERSRSGRGGHVWLLFDEAVPAALARKVGSYILTETMERRPDIGFDSYDRFFPNQDTLPHGGFGNLIALPLQKHARGDGNSVFLDDQAVPHRDQWAGEGFDDPRLDTLFLTLPVSWRGTIAQYVGRLHRLYDGKREVQVYDYADLNVPMLARMFDRRCRGYEAVGYTIVLPASAIPGWPADVTLPADPLWKRDYAASVRRLVRDGVDTPLANLFVTAARPIPPEAEGAKRARSASEAFLYRRLETLPETRGRFQLNADLPIAFDGWGRMEIDLLCADSRLVVEIDGAQHLADPVAYRRDRRKDQLLQENGYLVLRYLAEDLAKELDSVLDGILRSLSARRKPGAMAIPITVVRGSRV